jgi:hypothetical protein
MPSNNAPRYGRSVERQIIRENGYELADGGREWRDAVTDRDRDIEIKAAQRTRSNGQPGRFRIFRSSHEQLESESGAYHFAVYTPKGSGAQILKDRTLLARNISGFEWSNSDHDTRRVAGRAEQDKIDIDEIFG